MSRIVDKPIPPPKLDEQGRPVSFTWNGQVYRVVEILDEWDEWVWWDGSYQRTYYRVLTEDLGTWDLWRDRDGWWLHRIWD
nr:MAG: hypothetical protein DIU70_06695 [Bacillota bacterium]